MLVYIVDDEETIREVVKLLLEKENFEVETFKNGQEAFDRFTKKAPDLFILDIMMPVMDGISLLKKIREVNKTVSVIFLTSKDEEFDKILGLELGADDYIAKPFSIKELIARVHVIQRRIEAFKDTSDIKADELTVGNITLNLKSYTARSGDKDIVLTVTEFRLLKTFFDNVGNVLTREQLIQAAYPDDTFLNDRAIDCHIKRLRSKIGQDCIQTVYGLGYKYVL